MEIRLKINDVYLPYLNRDERYQLYYGGSGSGKSVFIAQRCIVDCISLPYFRLIYSRKTGKSIRQSSFQLFKDLIHRAGLSPLFTIKETTMEIICNHNGNNMIAAGLDDVNKLKSVAEPSHVWIEEADEVRFDDFLELDRRLRTSLAKMKIYLSFNPVSKQSWIYKNFFQAPIFESNQFLVLRTTYRDNAFLPADEKRKYDALKKANESQWKVYSEGEWGEGLKGLVFTDWTLGEFPENADFAGLDFGYNDPCAYVELKVDSSNLYVREVFYKSGLTTPIVAELLKSKAQPGLDIYADSASPDKIDELYSIGFSVYPQEKGPGSILFGIDKLKQYNLIVDPGSTNLIRELKSYCWKLNKEGNPMDVPVDYNNHAIDAMRSSLYTWLNSRYDLTW